MTSTHFARANAEAILFEFTKGLALRQHARAVEESCASAACPRSWSTPIAGELGL
jgi:hypothetical protein